MRTFISYRRSDRSGELLAHMIYRELRRRFGEGSAFLDIDTRALGLPFPEKLTDALDQSDAVFVVIGPDWLSVLQSRQADERDWVRHEVAESLRRPRTLVVPITTSGATMPSRSQLPIDIAELADRDGLSIEPLGDFELRVSNLIEQVSRTIGAMRPPALSLTHSPLVRHDEPIGFWGAIGVHFGFIPFAFSVFGMIASKETGAVIPSCLFFALAHFALAWTGYRMEDSNFVPPTKLTFWTITLLAPSFTYGGGYLLATKLLRIAA